MPNDTDTDVLAGGGADTSSDVLAGGGADPGADISAQDVSDAASQTTGLERRVESPLGGQQPAQLPPMIGQPPAGGVGPGAQQAPVGAGIHARHGGLLTGLAGVLLDGIAAGIMTPQSGQGFSQAAQRAYQMPAERQQQAMQMQQFKTQAELDKAKMAIAHVNQLQAFGLVNRLTDDQRAGVTEAFMKNVDMWTDQNLVDQLATTPNREEAAQQVHQYRSQDPDQGDQYWMYPTQHDGEWNVTQWGVYKMNPNKTVGKDTSIRIPWVDEQGNPMMKDVPIKADTKMVDLAPFHNDAYVKGLMAMAAKAEAAKAKGGPLVVATMPDQSLKVMGAEEAKQQNLFNYPLKDPGLVQQLAGSMNDLQTGINQLARVNIGNVQPGLAAALLEQQDPKLFAEMAPKLEGLGVGVSGGKLAIEGKVPDRVMAELRKMNVSAANADTRNYVVALQAAYEGLSQLPRLQTFGKTGRMLGHQVEAAQRMLIQPGDDADMTQRKLNALQNVVDPIKKGIPAMPGAGLTPSFRDPAGGGRGPQGRAVRDRTGKVLGYTTDGKTMTPVGAQ